jgi:hypothetical protein
MIEVYPVEETAKEKATILKTVERYADELRSRLESEDCDEAIHIYVSRKAGIITFDINNETYVDEGEGWQLCGMIS